MLAEFISAAKIDDEHVRPKLSSFCRSHAISGSSPRSGSIFQSRHEPERRYLARHSLSGALLGFVDQLKEFCPMLVKALGSVIIAAFSGNCIQLCQGYFRLEMALRLRQ